MELSDRAGFDGYERVPPSLAALRLGTLLAQRLDAVVPRPFRVQADAGWVALYEGAAFDSSSDVSGVLDQEIDQDAAAGERGSFAWNVAGVAWNVLSHVQDGISEGTKDPWPPLSGGRDLALPATRTDGVRVFMWYGPDSEREDDAVMSFAPIALDELLAPE
jgi:hypothetical protein